MTTTAKRISTSSFSASATSVMALANNDAKSRRLSVIYPENLLIALASSDSTAKQILSKKINANAIISKCETNLNNAAKSNDPVTTHQLPIIASLASILNSAESFANAEGSNVEPYHLIFGLLSVDSPAKVILSFYGMTLENAKKIYQEILDNAQKVMNAMKRDDVGDNGACCKGNASDHNKSNTCCKDNKTNTTDTNNQDFVSDKEWHDMLDVSIKLSQISGLSVVASFSQVYISNKSLHNKRQTKNILESITPEITRIKDSLLLKLDEFLKSK